MASLAGKTWFLDSVGVAIYPEDGLDARSLLAAADRGLYAVKRQGGDGVARAEPETNQITDALRAIGSTRLIGRQCEYHENVRLNCGIVQAYTRVGGWARHQAQSAWSCRCSVAGE